MPTRRGRLREPSRAGALAIVAAAAILVLVFAVARRDGLNTERAAAAASGWTGLLGGGRPPVDVSQWSIVVLKAPSLASRLAAAGGTASEGQERRWTRAAEAQQKRLLSGLALEGVVPSVEFSYTRVLNGFSALLDPQAAALLERSPQVQGVYPARVGYPAAVSRSPLSGALKAAGAAAHPPGSTLPGFDGAGVTVALLDTGVDRLHPYLAGRVLPGTDVIGGAGAATPQADPVDPSIVERHGTELAGIVAGKRGPAGLHGIAPGATILPIRIAGWQHDRAGGWAVYGRSDQLIAGLETAVDPNQDGDAHDAARIALVGTAEPYLSFPDVPEAKAVDGALALDTLVVTPAGNDLAAGPAYGTISGPGGARGALTVGAADVRTEMEQVPVAVRAGLRFQLNRMLPLAGAVTPQTPLQLAAAVPRRVSSGRPSRLSDFFDARGRSMVAGRAAVVAGGTAPEVAVENAARAGAGAVLVYGSGLPAGTLGLDEHVVVPVVAFPSTAARALRRSMLAGRQVTVSIGRPRHSPNASERGIAGFSSRGLAYDGRVKPDVVAPGVTVPTAEPGTNEDGTARFGTVNGSSAAAAGVAGAAAVLAEARPGLSAAALHGLLVGTATPLAGQPTEAQGAGLVDLGAAAAAEVYADPATLALPPFGASERRAVRTVTLTNVSPRRLRVRIASTAGSEAFSLTPSHSRVRLRPGRSARLEVLAKSVAHLPHAFPGVVTIAPEGGAVIHVPWLAAPRPPHAGLLWGVKLTPKRFDPQQTSALLVLHAGRILGLGSTPEIEPVSKLEIVLRRSDGKPLGMLARLRDQLPGLLSFGITGRAPAGQLLGPGRYTLVIRAYSGVPGPPSQKRVTFEVKRER